MPNRSIKSKARGSSVQLIDCLSSLFLLELLSPSPELYLISPWLSKVVLINNRFGQFRAVTSQLNKSELDLTDILTMLADRGTRVRIMCRPQSNQTEDVLTSLPNSVECRRMETLHEKGLVSHHFYLRGSMNFTHAGVNLNDESIELTRNPDEVARALVAARARWEAQ
jgi:phosphatidylserine/phosphatidylglycerophosphate/cardiolipin synthase-like enzyme